MRPGPGLVVMALAFISGARRGSTSTSSKISSSSTSSSSSSFTSTSNSEAQISSTSIFPSYLGGGGVLTPTDTPTTHQRERTFHSTNENTNTNNNNNNINNNNFYYSNYPPHALILPEHLRQHYDNPRARADTLSPSGSSSRVTKETRIARSIRTANSKDDRSSDIVGRAGGGTITDSDLSDSSVADSSTSEGTSEGLLVQFPSHSADSSRSFDEDDIFALVAEDDLLSEESFDRLSRLTNDKISYINEEDYSSTEGGGGSGGSERSFSSNENQQQDDSHSADDNSVGGGGNIYAANLVTNDETAAVAETEHPNSLSNTAKVDNTNTELKRSIFESEFPITRLNPWISACDLAQPGTAPDLQGQCSAGTLPVAWVDEGPGPPCPISCEQLRLNNKNNIKKNNFSALTNNNDKSKYIMNINTINFKANGNNNNNNYYNNIIMKKVRRDASEHFYDGSESISPTTITSTTTSATPKDTPVTMQNDGKAPTANNEVQNTNNILKMSTTNRNQKTFNNLHIKHSRQDINPKNNNKVIMNNRNKKEKRYTAAKDVDEVKQQQLQQQQQQQQKQNERKRNEKQEQCLDYLGDADESSPAYLCSLKSSKELIARLRTLRLKNCCERNLFSALHTVALNATLSGGSKCVRVLSDIMDLDALATRITCELAEILFRFDCRQVYSLIHQCNDCKVSRHLFLTYAEYK
ncbi:probable serine/threonine-protein kinase DDB_G0282963 [Teleopsis dalmanni]|uniref:probable serine/threonine-protein kinase DDB_G0282963 n=1 Tax=Teleopsis dalmanni TaxID=139649 RepID=UPI0018CDACD7|nr:probable serine/threonine-protein kinase DDB_G0282963 [Teleopsis dalmanni]